MSALVLALALLLAPPGSGLNQSEAGEGSSRPLDKKSRYLAEKSARSKQAKTTRKNGPRVGSHALKPRWARNLHTLEVRVVDGSLGPFSDEDRQAFFRCWFTREAGPLPAEILDVVLRAAEHFDRREIHVVSAFRHPKYNRMLRKKGREVARKSQHTRAQAIDF